MADTFKGIITADGKKRQLPYGSVLEIPVSDETLSIHGAFADSKAVGDKFKEVNAETDSLKEDLSNKITKFYASNQGETYITDSDNGKIQDMMLYGKSEQKQYSGKNLLNATLQTTTRNGITCINNGDGTYTLNGTATSDTQLVVGYHNILDGQVKMLGCPSGGSTKTYCVIMQFSSNITGGEKGRIYDIGNGGVGSTSNSIESGANYIRGIISIISGTTCNNLLFKPMITTDLTATYDNFEPYTGGIPSPSPDYPQEIKSVVNPTVKVCGENLYPGSDLIGLTKTYTTDFIPVILHKGKIYFSFDTSSDTSDGRYHINAKYFDINKELMGGNGNESIAGNNISHVSFEFDGTKAGINHETIDLKNVSYVKIMFGIYATTATKITYKNIMISATDSDFEPYKPIQTVTLPYTLNAIPVESGGNVTIDGQQYIADYVDVERGKLVRMVDSSKLDNTQSIVNKTEWLLAESQEIDLTTEEITAFKALTTYYPTTNISVNSEQLDGYTAFNYPISMANGWNYVKKQLNDNRDYIYDMDIQSAEAYVNSEYAVALTELEV